MVALDLVLFMVLVLVWDLDDLDVVDTIFVASSLGVPALAMDLVIALRLLLLMVTKKGAFFFVTRHYWGGTRGLWKGTKLVDVRQNDYKTQESIKRNRTFNYSTSVSVANVFKKKKKNAAL